MEPKYEDVYGALSGALLVLSGARMIEVDPYPDGPESLESDISWRVNLKNGLVVACLTPDVTDVIETCGGVLMCLGIRHQSGDVDMMEGILHGSVIV